MNEKISYDEAKNRVLEDKELEIWQNVITTNFSRNKENLVECDFQKITNCVGILMQKKMREYAVNKNIPCIYRFDKPQRHANDWEVVHGNTLNYFQDTKEHGLSVQRSVVPSTCSGITVARLNLLAISNYMQTKEVLFTPDIVDMVARYKNVKRKQSLLSA